MTTFSDDEVEGVPETDETDEVDDDHEMPEEVWRTIQDEVEGT
jgi:hypothetical protein